MVQNATEEKKYARSVNSGQGCSNTELSILGSSNKLDWFIYRFGLQHSAEYSTKPHHIKIFVVLLPTKLAFSFKYTRSFQKLLKELNRIAARFLN